MSQLIRKGLRGLLRLLLVAVIFWLGVLLHEVGHITIAVLGGARIVYLNILGIELFPSPGWHLLSNYYGYFEYEGALGTAMAAWVTMAGSLSTLAAALAGQIMLWVTRPRRGTWRLVVLTLCFFWADILTHTLPTLGIPAYLFIGRRTLSEGSEAYLGAVSLGMPGFIFQVLVVGISMLLLALTFIRWHRLSQQDKLIRVIDLGDQASKTVG